MCSDDSLSDGNKECVKCLNPTLDWICALTVIMFGFLTLLIIRLNPTLDWICALTEVSEASITAIVGS